MKKLLVLSTVLLVLTSAFIYSGDPAKDILGKWKIDEASVEGVTTSIINLTQKKNPDLAAQMEEQKDGIKDMVRSMSFEYKDDKTYAVQTPQGPQVGKWSFADNNKAILLTREGKPDRKDIILEISATRLRLVNTERGDTTLYIRP